MMRVLRHSTLLIAAFLLSTAVMFGQTYTIGADNGANTTTSYPSPFGDWYKTQRMQFLYLASELSAAGMTAGDITAISWNVVSTTAGVTENYTVKMVQTGTTSLGLTTWEGGASTVWGPANYTPTVGTNSFTLDVPFNWDGVSNIVIEICGGSNLGTYTTNATVTWTGPLAFNGSRTYRSDVELNPCGYVGATYSDYTPGGPDYRPRVTFTAAAAVECAGTPVAGSAVSTMESVCPDDLFTVSITPTAEAGITYQWASSTDGVIWSDIVGATSPSYATTQSVGTWYQATVTCTNTGDTDVSDAVYVGQNAPGTCYCEPTYSTGTSDGDYVSNVTLGTINNTTEGSDVAPYYTYYAGTSTDLTQGVEYTISITSGTYGSNNDVAAWIDWNADGDFDDAGEKLGEVQDLAALSTGNIVFTVPMDAVVGGTRLRVRESWNTIGLLPCAPYTYGETEDYDINVESAVPVCDQTVGLWADGITATTTDLHWDAAAGASDYWVTVADRVTQTVHTKIAVTSTSYTATGLTPGGSYYFKVRTYCVPDAMVAPVSDKYYWTTPAREGEINTNITLFPNPSDGQFTLSMIGFEGNTFNMNVYNSIGQVIYSNIVDVNSSSFTSNINLSDVSAGMYQVRFTNDQHDLSYSLVINK